MLGDIARCIVGSQISQ